jgi:hypothetical protein
VPLAVATCPCRRRPAMCGEAHSRREGEAAAESTPQLSDHFPGGQAAWLLLSVGQFASLLACVFSLLGIFTGLASLVNSAS